MSAIVVQNLRHRYGGREALRGVSFEVAEAEVFGLLGPNGSGKTTLFRILATLIQPTEGNVSVFGRDLRRDPAAVRRALGVVFQSPAIDPRLTVLENLVCHGNLYGLRGRGLRREATAVLEAVGLSDRMGSLAGALSGGQQRRVEIAKALLPEPRALILDEPSTGIDPAARREFWGQLTALRERRGSTIVLTTHLMDEASRCDRVAILDRGKLVTTGRPDELTATVGGEVMWISTPDAPGLAERLRDRFGVAAAVVDDRVRLERPRAHEFVPVVIEAFSGEVDAISVSRPTLDDAFVHHTGHRLD